MWDSIGDGQATGPHQPGDKIVFTVGHSNLSFDQFVKLLANFRIDLLADVRSAPYSNRFPHFSQPAFQAMLKAEGIGYLFMREELGGRPDDPDAYRRDGIVDYRARRASYAFRSGLERLLSELGQRSVALMCAEEDPLECHRFLMIGPELLRLEVRPLHVRRDCRMETQQEAENRLLKTHGFAGVAGDTLFPEARDKLYDLATAKQNELTILIQNLEEALTEVTRLVGWDLDAELLSECLKARNAVRQFREIKLDGSDKAKQGVSEHLIDIDTFSQYTRDKLLELAGIEEG